MSARQAWLETIAGMMIIYTHKIQKNCGTSDGRALARGEMVEFQVHMYLTLLEVLNRRESFEQICVILAECSM